MIVPTVVIVTGLPATGKTAIARAIGREAGLPVFGKDDFKELLFGLLGHSDREWSKKLGRAAYEVLFQICAEHVEAGASVVLESNFGPDSVPRFASIAAKFPVRFVQVLCYAEGEVVLSRFRSRVRHPGHVDEEVAETQRDLLLSGRADPLDIECELIEVDTTHLDHAAIDSIARRVLRSHRRK